MNRHADNQAKACVDAFRQVAESVFFAGRPADRSLAYFFRKNRKYGSRDRRIMMEGVFAAFRWWGGLLPLLTDKERQDFENRFETIGLFHAGQIPASGPNPADSRGWPGVASAAACLNAAIGLEDAQTSPVWDALQKMVANRQYSARAADENLYPPWATGHLAADVDPARLRDWLQRRPPMWLRLQAGDTTGTLGRLRQEGLSPQVHERLKTAVSVGNPRVNLYHLDSFRDGLYDVQDLASQVIGEVCSPVPGQRWWDACAGAGGKSLQLAALMNRKGTVVASDIRAAKLDDLRKRARRGRFPNIQYRLWNGGKLPVKKNSFDGLLVDAPCSCSGTWRRNPAARWQLQEKDVGEMADLQFDIVRGTLPALRPGGILVFATCSMFREENKMNVKRMLKDLPLEPVGFTHPLTGEAVSSCLQIRPWDGDCDAMFVARFKKI